MSVSHAPWSIRMSDETDYYSDDLKAASSILKWLEETAQDIKTRPLPPSPILIQQQLKSLEEYANKKESKLEKLNQIRNSQEKNVPKLVARIEDKLHELEEVEESHKCALEFELNKLRNLDRQYKNYEEKARARDQFFTKCFHDLDEGLNEAELMGMKEEIEREQNKYGDMLEMCEEMVNGNYKHAKKTLNAELMDSLKWMELKAMLQEKLQVSDESAPKSLRRRVITDVDDGLDEDDLVDDRNVEKQQQGKLKAIIEWVKSDNASLFRGVVYKLGFLFIVWPGIKYLLRTTYTKTSN